jgi:hypothetical protein
MALKALPDLREAPPIITVVAPKYLAPSQKIDENFCRELKGQAASGG